jgi:hypothetical protein
MRNKSYTILFQRDRLLFLSKQVEDSFQGFTHMHAQDRKIQIPTKEVVGTWKVI